LRVGIDVLVDRYADAFTNNLISHGMVYVKSTETVVPVPSSFFDIVFTVNAIDHVKNFDRMCNELLRILKPGGALIASFNLEEPATPAEPQRLTEQMVQTSLLRHLNVQSYRLARKEPEGASYAPLLNGTGQYTAGDEGFLWVRATKLAS
jgi:ubiquinone/menaquinone biosynthesis C-methylase UbiE